MVNDNSSGVLLRTSRRIFDVIIVGSGIAGLLLACDMESRGMKTLLLCKGKLHDSNTSFAQGGLAAVTGDNFLDSPAQHLEDTLKSGAGLTDRAVARMIVEDGGRVVAKLEELGVCFERSDAYRDLAREGGHSQSRVLHNKDSSGRAITSALIDILLQSKRTTIRENTFVADLMIREGRCVGVIVSGNNGTTSKIFAKQTVLASGGPGRVFSRTTNPDVATGDGIAMAYRAGARLVDMEFVQFHPTSLAVPGQSTFLVSEAVRGAGAILLDRNDERFAFNYSSDGELGTRDIVARAIHATMLAQGTGYVRMDMRPVGIENIKEKFPVILSECRKRGVDPLTEPIPVAPAAHYFMGGIWTDPAGNTTIPGLYAIGECASTGLHGANRLASNSLLEGGVMALRLADHLAGLPDMRVSLSWKIERPVILTHPDCTADTVSMFRARMGTVAGLVRHGEPMEAFIASRRSAPLRLSVPSSQRDMEAANISLIGELIVQSALNRRESRGAHWRTDYPCTNDVKFQKRFIVDKESSGWLPVTGTICQPPPIDIAM